MDETCRLRRGEGYGARVDDASGEAGETAGAFSHQPSHLCPQCGQFQEIKIALICGC